MIKHAAKITAINPSAARFAHEEMLGFMLVRISVLAIYLPRGIFIRLSSINAFPNVSLRLGLKDQRALLRSRLRRRFEIYARTP
jgi:hypothetical protein